MNNSKLQLNSTYFINIELFQINLQLYKFYSLIPSTYTLNIENLNQTRLEATNNKISSQGHSTRRSHTSCQMILLNTHLKILLHNRLRM